MSHELQRGAVTNRLLTLSVQSFELSIIRLNVDRSVPVWAIAGAFFSVTRTSDELSIVCESTRVPDLSTDGGAACDGGWRSLKVQGPLDFSLVGILAELASRLAAEGVSIFAISTYDTDYLLVQGAALRTAIGALESAGHTVVVQD